MRMDSRKNWMVKRFAAVGQFWRIRALLFIDYHAPKSAENPGVKTGKH